MTKRPDLIDRWLSEFFIVLTLIGGVIGAALLVLAFV